MEITFESVKNEKNIRERGLSFERVAKFDFETAGFLVDDRRDYGETRHIAVGHLDAAYTFCVLWRPSAVFA